MGVERCARALRFLDRGDMTPMRQHLGKMAAGKLTDENQGGSRGRKAGKPAGEPTPEGAVEVSDCSLGEEGSLRCRVGERGWRGGEEWLAG
jgi:hypothetical protein